jgi:hypothetical protein
MLYEGTRRTFSTSTVLSHGQTLRECIFLKLVGSRHMSMYMTHIEFLRVNKKKLAQQNCTLPIVLTDGKNFVGSSTGSTAGFILLWVVSL